MALAAEIVYTAIDDSGERGTTSISVPTAFSLSQFQAFATSMGTLLDAILGAKVESAEICFGVDISALTSNVAASTSDVEEIGAFQFRTSEGLPVHVNVPCIDETKVASGSDDINQADAAIAAFLTGMETGVVVTGATIGPSDVAGVSITSTDYARERFRASGTRR